MMAHRKRQASIGVIFLTVFLDLVGFGIVLPMLPIFSRDFGASGWIIGIISASFSAMQFLFAPAWGRLSDRVGRRPVMLASLAASTLSYAVFALGSSLESHAAALAVLLASRILAGICGANITVAQAYIADITPPEKRSKRLGLIGMAFGLGFIFGPFIGSESLKWFGMSGPGWVAAAFCGINFLYAVFALPESWKPASSEHASTRPRVSTWREVLRRPGVGLLIHTFGLATFAFACFETTLGLLIMRNFHLDVKHDVNAQATVGYLYALSGVIGAIVQGGLIGRLVKQFGEARLVGFSLLLTAAALLPMPLITGAGYLSFKALFQSSGGPWALLLLLLALLSIGTALTRPPLFGLLTTLTPAHEQGMTIGVAQSVGSLARILGPMFAASLFFWNPLIPYAFCSAVLIGAGWRLKQLFGKATPVLLPAKP